MLGHIGCITNPQLSNRSEIHNIHIVNNTTFNNTLTNYVLNINEVFTNNSTNTSVNLKLIEKYQARAQYTRMISNNIEKIIPIVTLLEKIQ